MIRILIVDDQNIIREGLKVLLETASEIEIVGYAEDGESALQKVSLMKPDVVLLDINLPGIDGLSVADKISSSFPQTKAIMLSSSDEDRYVSKAMKSSAKGYLLKNVSAEELEWSIRLVHQGYSSFKSDLLEKASLDPSSANNSVKSPSNRSGDRQPQVSASLSNTPTQRNPSELELLYAKNQFQHKYSDHRNRQKGNPLFHSFRVSRAKKTMMSFEVKLLVFTILCSLGFLIFVALS